MLIEPRSVELKSGQFVTLKSPESYDADKVGVVEGLEKRTDDMSRAVLKLMTESK